MPELEGLPANLNLVHSADGSLLSLEHRDKLRRSALTDAQISSAGYRTDQRGHLQIPYLQPDGSQQACHDGRPFARFRLTDAEVAADPKGGKYRSPKGEGCRIYHSPLAIAAGGYPDRLASVHLPLRITEGELKTDAATVHDPKRVTIGLSGVNSWVDRYDGGDGSRPVIELEEIPIEGREVRLCFDSDVQKPKVRAALRKLAEWLHERGAHVLIERLPNAMEQQPDGSPVRLGLDDLIYHHGAKFFRDITDAAEAAFVTRGKGGNAETVFRLPDEPSGPESTFRRALLLHGLIGHEWRADPEHREAWWTWTGTHWAPVAGNDQLLHRIEQFFDRQGWREARTGGNVQSLLAAFRRKVGSLNPSAMTGLLPCQNGVLRLSDLALLPHDPTHQNTWALAFPWQPMASAGRIETFLAEVLGDPADVAIIRAVLLRMVAGPRWKGFVELAGPPDSAKSVIGNIFEALAGSNGFVSMELASLEDTSARFETLRLRGKRLAIINEAGSYHGKLERLKALSGGDLIRAERKGSTRECDFHFHGLIVAIGNAPIRSTDTSAAVLNRRRSISTPRAIPVARQRPMLDPADGGGWAGELAPHLPGLLRWVLAMTPAEATAALSTANVSPARAESELAILLDSDYLAAWADEHLIFDPAAVARVGDALQNAADFLFPNYRQALEGADARPLSAKNFKTKLVGLLRDHLGLPLPAGLTSTGSYRDRSMGSLVPSIRFRSPVDGDVPGVIRHAMQLRMSQPVMDGDGSEMAARWQKPSGGTDGMDVTDRSHSLIAREKKLEKLSPYMGKSDLSITSVTSVPGQGSSRHASISDPSPSITDPSPCPPEVGSPDHRARVLAIPIDAPVEIREPGKTSINGHRMLNPLGGSEHCQLTAPDGGTVQRPKSWVWPCTTPSA